MKVTYPFKHLSDLRHMKYIPQYKSGLQGVYNMFMVPEMLCGFLVSHQPCPCWTISLLEYRGWTWKMLWCLCRSAIFHKEALLNAHLVTLLMSCHWYIQTSRVCQQHEVLGLRPPPLYIWTITKVLWQMEQGFSDLCRLYDFSLCIHIIVWTLLEMDITSLLIWLL